VGRGKVSNRSRVGQNDWGEVGVTSFAKNVAAPMSNTVYISQAAGFYFGSKQIMHTQKSGLHL
jgi:hypothetical protein